MNKSDYHHHYWQRYRAKKQRVTVTLSKADYQALCARASKADPNRKPGHQLWLESQAYLNNQFLPNADIAHRVDRLYHELHRLYDQLVEAQSSFLARPSKIPEILSGLCKVKTLIDSFVSPQRS